MNKRFMDYEKYDKEIVFNEYDYSDTELENKKELSEIDEEKVGLHPESYNGFRTLLESKGLKSRDDLSKTK